MKKFFNLLRNRRGASAAEYGLILAIVGSVIAVASIGLSAAIGNAMEDPATCVGASGADGC